MLTFISLMLKSFTVDRKIPFYHFEIYISDNVTLRGSKGGNLFQNELLFKLSELSLNISLLKEMVTAIGLYSTSAICTDFTYILLFLADPFSLSPPPI